MHVTLNNTVQIYTASGMIEGYVCDILPADKTPDPEQVKTYYQVSADHEHFKAFCMKIKYDRLVIKKLNGEYFIFIRSPKVDRYILDLQITGVHDGK
jgi:hypothetical protein